MSPDSQDIKQRNLSATQPTPDNALSTNVEETVAQSQAGITEGGISRAASNVERASSSGSGPSATDSEDARVRVVRQASFVQRSENDRSGACMCVIACVCVHTNCAACTRVCIILALPAPFHAPTRALVSASPLLVRPQALSPLFPILIHPSLTHARTRQSRRSKSG